MSALTIALIFIMVMIALCADAKASDVHALTVRRLYRRIRKVQRANELTQLDAMYYVNQVGK